MRVSLAITTSDLEMATTIAAISSVLADASHSLKDSGFETRSAQAAEAAGKWAALASAIHDEIVTIAEENEDENG